jgi:hypothetical protein
MPEKKIVAVGAAGAASTIILWLAGYYAPELMATAPVGLEAAFTALIATVAGYMKRN